MSYEVNSIFADMEQELIQSYYRNMSKHSQEELREGFSWEMWQRLKLQSIAQYQKESRRIVDKSTKKAISVATGEVEDSFGKGISTVDAVVGGLSTEGRAEGFFQINQRKLDALLDAVNNDYSNAAAAALRLTKDEYRKIIFGAQVMFSSGAGTLQQAIDMAAKDFLHQGINCIQYKNGAKVNIASYAELSLRASAKKAYLTGEGARSNELGIHLVQVTSYGGCSPLCLPWQGRVFVDDVYANGRPDGVHQLLSLAMSEGLYHPNCRHTHGPYFEGISYDAPEFDEGNIKKTYEAEQKQRAIERKIREWKRIQEGSLDPTNKQRAGLKVKAWQGAMRDHLGENTFLTRKYTREKTYGISASPTRL